MFHSHRIQSCRRRLDLHVQQQGNLRLEIECRDGKAVGGCILRQGRGRAQLFYAEPDGKASFRNVEFKAKVKTTAGSNSGIYFHTAYQEKGWPAAGCECQVNATHTDRKKTGGLYAVADVMDNAPKEDGEWFDHSIKVDGRHIVVKINGIVTTDSTQPEDWDVAINLKGKPGHKPGESDIAIQANTLRA